MFVKDQVHERNTRKTKVAWSYERQKRMHSHTNIKDEGCQP